VTHSGYILRHLRVDAAHVMVDGRIVCSGEPDEILEDVMEKGYDGCRRCQRTERKPKLQ
jgi:Fe-S cluster assembly ATP-binding protein